MTVIEKTTAVQESVLINAPPEAVWRVFSRIERWPQWVPGCTQAAYLSGKPWAVGSQFQFAVKLRQEARALLGPAWLKMSMKPTIVESEPPTRVTWLGRISGIYAQQTFRFEPEGAGTRVTTYEVFSGPMLWTLPLVAPQARVRKLLVQWLAALKAQVEKG